VAATHDVLLIGGGGGGLRAATIAETNPSLNVAVVSKVYPMRVTLSQPSAEQPACCRGRQSGRTRLRHHPGSDWLADQDAVEAFVQEVAELLQPSTGAVRGAANQTGGSPYRPSAG
jgi:fumarate reductase flavoprotein subunit